QYSASTLVTAASALALARQSSACGRLAWRRTNERLGLEAFLGNCSHGSVEQRPCLIGVEDEAHQLERGLRSQVLRRRLHRDSRPLAARVAVDPHADGRKRHAASSERIAQLKAGPIGAGEMLGLAAAAS